MMNDFMNKLSISDNCIEFTVLCHYHGKCTLREGVKNYVCSGKSSQQKTRFVQMLKTLDSEEVYIFVNNSVDSNFVQGLNDDKIKLIIFDECEYSTSKGGKLEEKFVNWLRTNQAIHILIGRNFIFEEACHLESVKNSPTESILAPVK